MGGYVLCSPFLNPPPKAFFSSLARIFACTHHRRAPGKHTSMKTMSGYYVEYRCKCLASNKNMNTRMHRDGGEGTAYLHDIIFLLGLLLCRHHLLHQRRTLVLKRDNSRRRGRRSRCSAAAALFLAHFLNKDLLLRASRHSYTCPITPAATGTAREEIRYNFLLV